MFIFASTNPDIVESVEKEPAITKEFLQGLPKEGTLFNLFGTSVIQEFKHSVGKGGTGGNSQEISIRFLDKQVTNSFEAFYVNAVNLGVISQFKKYFSSVDSLLTDDFKEAYSKNTTDRFIYVIYGYGNKKSGPHKCTLTGFNITTAKGILQYNLKLAPTSRDISATLFKDRVFKKAATKPDASYFEGVTDEIKVNESPVYGKDKYQRMNSSKFGPVSPPPIALESVDYHLLIKDLIKDLLRNLFGTNNVIVLLPDISIICQDSILEFYKNSTYFTKNEDPSPSPMLFGTLKTQDDKKSYTIIDQYLQKYHLIEAFVDQLGDSVEIEKDAQKSSKFDINDPDFNDKFLRDQTQFRNFDEYVKYSIEKYIFKLSIKGYGFPFNYGGKKSPLQALNDLVVRINQLSKYSNYKFNYFVETNLKFNKLLTSQDFVQTDLLSGNSLDDENIVIFGEETLVNKYLYGIDRNTDIAEDNLERASLTEIFPLHPLDEAVLTSEEFRASIIEFLPNRQHFLPIFVDEKNTTEGVGVNEYKGEVGVLDYTINDQGTFLGALTNVTSEKVQNTAKVIGDTAAKIAEHITVGGESLAEYEIVDLVEQMYAINSFDYDKTDKFFGEIIDSIDLNNVPSGQLDPKEQLKQRINYILANLEKDKKTLGPNLAYDDSLFVTQGKIQSAIQQNLSRLGLSVSVTTKFCPQYGSYYLVGKSAKLKVSPGKFRLNIPEYYVITGYTHTISNKSMVSKFELERKF